jgi:hypothetical protein
VTLSITTLCHYAECRVLSSIMFNVIMLSVVMLCAVMLSVVAPLTLSTKKQKRVEVAVSSKSTRLQYCNINSYLKRFNSTSNWDCIHDTSFSSYLTKGLNKLVLHSVGWKGLLVTITEWTHEPTHLLSS